jgi:hypothetical protein
MQTKWEKISVRNLINMYSELNQVKDLRGPKDAAAKFAYAIHRNMDMIQTNLFNMRARFPIQQKEANTYDTKRIELLEKFCLKDDEGAAVIEDGSYTGLEANEEFNAAMVALDAEHADFLKGMDDYMKAECELSFYKILPDFLPGVLTANDISRIAFIITEDLVVTKKILA